MATAEYLTQHTVLYTTGPDVTSQVCTEGEGGMERERQSPRKNGEREREREILCVLVAHSFTHSHMHIRLSPRVPDVTCWLSPRTRHQSTFPIMSAASGGSSLTRFANLVPSSSKHTC